MGLCYRPAAWSYSTKRQDLSTVHLGTKGHGRVEEALFVHPLGMYNHIWIHKGDDWKTAFITPAGHYDYLVMPYGLSNSPSMFQGFMNEGLILIYSWNLVDHCHHITWVLQKLRTHHSYLKLAKCKFHKTTISFHHQPARYWNGPGEGTSYLQLATTLNYQILQRYLGFENIYWWFIANYSKITLPLTTMLKNRSKSLYWDPSATIAFHQLKEGFPVLVHPDPELPFIVAVDTSTTGVGAVLSQQQVNSWKLRRNCPRWSKIMPSVTRSCWLSSCP